MEVVASGFGLTETPRFDSEGRLWFTDVTEGGVRRLLPDGEVETVVPKRRGIGGLVLHQDGGVVMSGRDLIHVGPGGGQRTLLNLEQATGFNDLVADADGRVLAGVLTYNPMQGEKPRPGSVVRVLAEGRAEELFGGVDWPNGIGTSPDGRAIYLADYATGRIMRFMDGELHEFAQSPAGADGLAVDEEGGIWLALGQAGAIGRFSPEGQLEHLVEVPAEFVSSLTFGGEDMRDLYVTAYGSVLRGRADVAGLKPALARL